MFFSQPIIQKLGLSPHHNTEILRLDLIHPQISGNKWFKLKYNIQAALRSGTILTFGGAFSNHILATAVASKLAGIKSIGIIRGEKSLPLNSTLEESVKNGMQLEFVSRDIYSKKEDPEFINSLHHKFGDFFLVPEGGSNVNGVLGCKEILRPEWRFDYILCACGTGTTFAGLLAASKPGQIVIGINVLKGENSIVKNINSICSESGFICDIKGNDEILKPVIVNSCVTDHFAFKGYAKYDKTLFEYKKNFEEQRKINLDHVYTNKLLFAAESLIKAEKIPAGSRVLIIHSGGLQGNAGFEKRFNLG